MLTTFDRYLLSKYCHVVFVFCVATVGLFAVVDGFTNLDAFQSKVDQNHGGTFDLFLRIGQYYLFQSALILDTAGPTIMVLSAMSALALMLRHGEIHPVLAAGVPTYRATLPLMGAVLAANVLLSLNQELILPSIAPHLQGRHGEMADDVQRAESQYDYKSKILVSGKGIVPAEQKLQEPEFLLPTPVLVSSFVSLQGDNAYYIPPGSDGAAAGWLVQNIQPKFEDLPLTETGRRMMIPQPNGTDVFIHMGLSFDQMNRQAANPRLVSTAGLIRKLQQPSSTLLSRRRLEIKLHERITRPILTLIGLYLVIPLVVRKERMSVMQQVTNIATCAAVLGGVFGGVMGFQMLGEAGLMRPELAVWGALIGAGGLAGWLSGTVRT